MFLYKKKVIFLVVLCLYAILFLLLMLYWMYTERNRSDGETPLEEKTIDVVDQRNNPKLNVEVWGKASISLYLWKRILKGPFESLHNGFMNIGNMTIDNFQFSFKNGPGFIQTTVPQNVEYLVLVLNGRSNEKVQQAKQWLSYLKNLHYLKKTCVFLLGSEQCDNNWILPYMKSADGRVDTVFLVYDSLLVDDKEFFQWPLGVAEYRGFPDFSNLSESLLHKRKYIANFVGSIYKGSSRETLVNIIKSSKLTSKVHLIGRNNWIPNETEESRQQYISALQSSDLTLSPVGMNTECYRIYEAMSVGSVPVIEDVVTPGTCERRPPAPLRLLKRLHAPVIWLSNWTQLDQILHNENELSFREKTARRIQVVKWYNKFKEIMKSKFLEKCKLTLTELRHVATALKPRIHQAL